MNNTSLKKSFDVPWHELTSLKVREMEMIDRRYLLKIFLTIMFTSLKILFSRRCWIN